MARSAEGIVEEAATFRGIVRYTKRDWIEMTGLIGPDFIASLDSEGESQRARPLVKLVEITEAQNERAHA